MSPQGVLNVMLPYFVHMDATMLSASCTSGLIVDRAGGNAGYRHNLYQGQSSVRSPFNLFDDSKTAIA